MFPSPDLPPEPKIAAWEWRGIVLLQILYFLIALPGIDAPFTSMHFVRQNQTYDVAHHVYEEGWPAIITPRASFSQAYDPNDTFSPLTLPQQRYTIIHLEVPFHGIFGWPAAQLFPNHSRAIARLVSVAATLLLMVVFHRIIRRWIDPIPALAGVALFVSAPIIVHFGQVPTPDILATTGVAISFLYALRGNTAASSAAFLFTVLAKMSIILYGLPVLTALLVARNCRTAISFLTTAALWGAAPLLGIIVWILQSRHDPYGSWVVIGGFRPGSFGPITAHDLVDLRGYIQPAMFLLPFGCGVLGATALLFAARNHPPLMNIWLKAAIALALLLNYVGERIVWREPQYTVPVLFWLFLAASLGLPGLLALARKSGAWKITFTALLLLHLAIAANAIWFLKASRVPNFASIIAAGNLTPTDARIVVYAATPNASPSSWLGRNTLTVVPLPNPPPPEMLSRFDHQLQTFSQAGFTYLLVFDAQEHRSLNPLAPPSYESDYTSAKSPVRQHFDSEFQRVFEGNHVVLYALPGSG
jgi:hypothetical protein